jgi:hypothetical protein
MGSSIGVRLRDCEDADIFRAFMRMLAWWSPRRRLPACQWCAWIVVGLPCWAVIQSLSDHLGRRRKHSRSAVVEARRLGPGKVADRSKQLTRLREMLLHRGLLGSSVSTPTD